MLFHLRQQLLAVFCMLFIGHATAQTGHFFSSDLFSSSLISSICQDHQGSVWIGTDYGLNKFDGYHFASYLHSDDQPSSLAVNVVVSLLCDREGRLWVGTNRGLDRYDYVHDSFVHYPFPDNLNPRISTILQRKDGTILVGTAGYGAFELGKDNKLHLFSLADAGMYFSRFYEDDNGRLWKSGFDDEIAMRLGDKVVKFKSTVGTPMDFVEVGGDMFVACQHGFMRYHNGVMSTVEITNDLFRQHNLILSSAVVNESGTIYIGTRGKGVYTLSTTAPYNMEHASINAAGIDANTAKVDAVMFDRNGNLWLGCFRKGLLMVPLRPMQFSGWLFSTQGINLGSTISSVCEGDDGVTWCTVQGVGVYGFNSKGQVVAHPSAPQAVEFIFRDPLKRYWIGTDDGLFAYDPLTGRSQLKVNFECDKFNDMTCDQQGNIYISTFSRGFCVYNPTTGSLVNHNFYQTDSVRGTLCNNWVMCLSADSRGLIWIGTSSGVSCFDPVTGSFRSQQWNSLLSGVVCFDVCELHKGRLNDGRQLNGCIAIGTEQGLYLYDRQARKVEPFPGSEQLKNKAVCYVVQSNDGDIWCSTSMGIWQYDVRQHTFIGHVNGNGLTNKEYLYGVGMHTDNDMIYFGQKEGLTVFSPKDIKLNKPMLDPLQLSAFLVGSTGVNVDTELNGVHVTDKPVTESDHFTLSYLDHTITLCFSQFNYDNPMNVTLEYMINGGQWVRSSEGKNDITFSHLQPGTYRIQVRAQVGNEYTPEKIVVVTVRAPWYRSQPAYIVYFLIVLALLAYAFFTYRRRANEQMNEEKMKFLINATHDIRSPLTLIMGPLQKVKEIAASADLQSPMLNESIDTIDRNAHRILNLVNQILDVRKIDKQQMLLHCQLTDIVSYTKGICKMFEFNAKERNIEFGFTPDCDQLDVWIDRNQFDKVLTNLLSNAFKYSYEGGKVEIRLTHDEQNVSFSIIDTGGGLDNDSLKHMFDRFYQGNNSRRMHIDGTGIGLNLCKMIVDMHHGTIQAQNRTDGTRGSVFTVSLPLGKDHLLESEIEVETAPEIEEQPQVTKVQTSGNKYRVLIVDDDVEIGKYISSQLSHYYKFSLCPNGKEGLRELLASSQNENTAYDVVISDVMMPEMDGFTMLRMIKTNMNISHIPVILLTSKADVGNRLEGLERGADAFLAKPFDMEELHMVIENLIHNRQRLKGKYSGAQQQADKVEQPEVKGNDEQLMERIMKSVNKNLSNSDFNVDMLTQEVGISRAQLHRKMKDMTGISTSEFIRNIRLEQAARLLREQKINITQVAYTVGFSNLAHFSTIFRKHFGVSPSEFVERES